MPLRLNSPSVKFSRVYESLPVEAQRSLVENQLVALLDLVPKEKAKKVVSAATRLQTCYSGIPTLDLPGKKKEINFLLEELAKDSKRSFIKDRSNKDELLEETIDTLVNWLNDIWSLVYEYNVNFAHAHACLLFVADVLDQINDTHDGYKCALRDLAVDVTIKKKSGKIVKTFALRGAHNIDQVLLWIWRDLFVSMSASGGRRGRTKIPQMLVDIEDVLGWQALERLLYGGKDPLSEKDDVFDFDPDHDDESCQEEDDDSDQADSRCQCHFHARHWSDKNNRQRFRIRELVLKRLLAIFEVTPSLRLYNRILSISLNADQTAADLLAILSDIAPSSTDTLTAALDIYALESDTTEIATLLKSHSHLLRPRDAPTLQCAVTVLSDDPSFQLYNLQIPEKELNETARTIRAALQSCFCNIEEVNHQEELAQIIKLRSGTQQRRDRIERWVDAVITPGSPPVNPVVFAAMMFGLPMVPGMDDGDDPDPLGYLDLNPTDPDFEDLREEFRPRLKERFECWNETALTVKGGPGVLIKVYSKFVELMPFLRASDVVDEMIGRLADKHSKRHICDALDALSTFCKLQRKKNCLQAAEKKWRTETQKQSQAGANSPTSFRAGATGFAFSFNSTGEQTTSSASQSFSTGIGGMDDVD